MFLTPSERGGSVPPSFNGLEVLCGDERLLRFDKDRLFTLVFLSEINGEIPPFIVLFTFIHNLHVRLQCVTRIYRLQVSNFVVAVVQGLRRLATDGISDEAVGNAE